MKPVQQQDIEYVFPKSILRFKKRKTTSPLRIRKAKRRIRNKIAKLSRRKNR